MPPLVAVIGYTDLNRYGNLSHVLPVAYTRAIERAGGIPYILPYSEAMEGLAATLAPARGCLFSGGIDIDPCRYGEEKRPCCGATNLALDAWQLAVFNLAMTAGLPILAICRGAQLANVALGGTLHQDVFAELPGPLCRHSGADAQPGDDHQVTCLPGSRLHRLLGASLTVNSRHHQAIKRLGPGLTATAWSEDGVIEGAEHSRLPIDLVQWHPELMADSPSGSMLPLFRHFVDCCTDR